MNGGDQLATLKRELATDRGMDELAKVTLNGNGHANGQDSETLKAAEVIKEQAQAEAVKGKMPDEADMADAFAETHEGEVLFIPERGRWFMFDHEAGRWRADNESLAWELAKQIARKARGKTDSKGRISFMTVRGMLNFASKIPGMFRGLVDDLGRPNFDPDPRMICTANGWAVNLETRKARRATSGDWFMRSTGADYDPDAACDRFDQFHLETLPDDRDTREWFEQVLGYCLTGEVREHLFLFAVGRAGTGKTT